MRFCVKRIFIMSSIALLIMIGAFNIPGAYADDNLTMQKLIGTWWTHDANQVPWAIKFNEDGTGPGPN
jgi:hypothetical protein